MEAVRLMTAELCVGAVLALVERLQADGALALVQGDSIIASLLLHDEPKALSTSRLLHRAQLPPLFKRRWSHHEAGGPPAMW